MKKTDIEVVNNRLDKDKEVNIKIEKGKLVFSKPIVKVKPVKLPNNVNEINKKQLPYKDAVNYASEKNRFVIVWGFTIGNKMYNYPREVGDEIIEMTYDESKLILNPETGEKELILRVIKR
jgi:hypothetical protein